MPSRAMAALIAVTATALAAVAFAEEEGGCVSGGTDEERQALARAAFGEGQRLVVAHQFDAAVAAFRCSFQNVPHPATMYNVGRAAELAGRMRVALDAWRSYLRLSPEAEDRGEVERHVAALEASLEAPVGRPEAPPPVPTPAPVASPFDTPLPVRPPPPAPAYPPPAPAYPASAAQPAPNAAPAPLPPPPPAPRSRRSGRGLRVSGWTTFGVTYGLAALCSLIALGGDPEPWYLLIPVAGPAVFGHVASGSETYLVALMWIWTLIETAGVTMLAVGYARGISAARATRQRSGPRVALLPGGPGGSPGLTVAGAFF